MGIFAIEIFLLDFPDHPNPFGGMENHPEKV
jgi:hypothetical protein